MFWRIIAWIVSRPAVATWLINKAKKTPYTHITKGDSVYMERYWLFNSYQSVKGQQEKSKYPWFPWNIRLHWIRRPDEDRDMHDHPWHARTIILRGGYRELRIKYASYDHLGRIIDYLPETVMRKPGDTATIGFEQYHRIMAVAPGGAWTLFISGRYQGTWGFLVNGVKVPFRKYLGWD